MYRRRWRKQRWEILELLLNRELEVMTGSLRVATLKARETSTALEIPAKVFHAMLAENHPAATKLITHMAKTLARRLAAVNQRIMEKPSVAASANDEPEEVDVSDIMEEPATVDDADLDVLDKLWS